MVKEEKSTKSRLEKLQEWRKQREDAKAKQRAQEKKNPPFRPCGLKRAVPTTTTHNSPATKSLAATKKTTSSKPTPDAIGVRKTAKSKTAPPPRLSARLAAKHQAVASIIHDTSRTREPLTRPVSKNSSSVASTSTKPPARARQTTTSKNQGDPKPPVTRNVQGRNAATNVKSAPSKAVAPVSRKTTKDMQKSVSEKHTTRSASSKTTTTKRSEVNKKNSTSKGPSSTQNKASRKVKAHVEEEGEGLGNDKKADEPPTPTKHSYVPVHPSPLLKRQVAPVRRETVFMPQFVNDPAWIPGACDFNAASHAMEPNFDEAFQTASFSPFRFTAAPSIVDSSNVSNSSESQQSQFVFKPLSQLSYDDISTSSSEMDSCNAGSNQEAVNPPAPKRRRNSRRCSRRLEIVSPRVKRVESSSESESSSTEGTHTQESQEGTTSASGKLQSVTF